MTADMELVASNHLMADPVALRAEFARSGCVLLRQVAPKEAVEAVAEAMVRNLTEQGYMDAGGSWTGMPTNKVDDDALHHAMPYPEMWRRPEMIELYELILGEPVYVFKQSQPRYVTASDGEYLNPAHQDACLIGPNDDFITAWTPLCEMPLALGGVGVAIGSHVHGKREHIADPHQKNLRYGELPQKGIPDETVSEPWATTNYSIGDVVMFQSYTVHRSMANTVPGRVRLSIDTRVQPETSERGFVATHTTPEIRAAKTGPVYAQHLEQ